MKRLILAVIGVGILVGLGFYVKQPKTQPVPPMEPGAEAPMAAAEEPLPATEPVAAQIEQPAPRTDAPSIAKPVAPTTPVPASRELDTALVRRAVDLLVSTQVSFGQKREAWKQLRDAGKLDQAIVELERLAVAEPQMAEYQAALGQAYLKKCATIDDLREQGILAMQADKLFDTALSLDGANWEARFTKAVAMSYWPPTLNRGEEVVQQFQTLIKQQEAQTPQPEFAETYAWLGDQYQKAGRTDDAQAVWQRGAALFPADEKLRTKLAAAH